MGKVIGIVGLGRMGAPICARLVEGGFEVLASDRAEEKRAIAELAGARWMPSAAQLAAESDVVITVLPGPVELASAMTGDGLLHSMREGATWLDLTSGDPRVSDRLAADARARGIRAVAAPMGGGPNEARTGELLFFVGGQPADVESVRPLLTVLGRAEGLRDSGTAVGAAQTTKLLANLLWFGQAAAVTEALLLGQAMGLDPRSLRDTLGVSAGGSRFIDGSTDALLRGDYLDSFALSRCLEELETLQRLATSTGSPFELSGTVTRLHREALDEFGEVDGELLVARLLEQRAGRTLRAAPGGAS